MNRILRSAFRLAILACAVTAVSCGSGKKEPEIKSMAAPEAAPEQALSSSFYKRLEGTIAGQPVVMYLHCYGGTLAGSYYYVKQGKPIELAGEWDAAHPNRIEVKEMADGNEEATALPAMEGTWENGGIKGSWYDARKTKTYLIDLKEAYPKGCYTFAALNLTDSAMAYPGTKESPEATVTRQVLIPLQAENAWLSGQIVQLIADSSAAGTDIPAVTRESGKTFLNNYKKDIEGLKTENPDMASMLNYEDELRLFVVYNNNGLLAIAKNFYGYTGGAHGYGGVLYTCFDVENRRKLSLSDVISADSVQLQPVMEAAFRKAYGLNTTDSLTGILFENHLETTNNFFITPTGLGFLYLQYEVAPYAAGPIYVFVPYADLRRFLRPDFAKRMQLQ